MLPGRAIGAGVSSGTDRARRRRGEPAGACGAGFRFVGQRCRAAVRGDRSLRPAGGRVRAPEVGAAPPARWIIERWPGGPRTFLRVRVGQNADDVQGLNRQSAKFGDVITRRLLTAATLGLACATTTPSWAASMTVLPTNGGIEFRRPSAVVYDVNGNLYVADRSANRILIARPGQALVSFAGSESGEAGYIDGPASLARFNRPSGLAVGNAGEIYVADTENHTVRVITPLGVVTTFAGTTKAGTLNGPKRDAQFVGPTALAADGRGDVFIADGTAGVREVTAGGNVSTLPLDVDQPIGIAVGESSTLFVSDREGIVAAHLDGTAARRIPMAARTGPNIVTMQGGLSIGQPLGLAALDGQSALYTASDGTIRYIDVAQLFVRTVASGPPLTDPVALAVAPNGTVAVANRSGSVTVVAQVNLRRPIMPGDTGVIPAHLTLNRFDYNIAYIGSSFIWWDTGWDDSIEGLLEHSLQNDPQARPYNPRVTPVVVPGGTLSACEQFSEYLGELRMVRLIILDVSRSLIVQSYSVPIQTIAHDREAWEPKFTSDMMKLRADLVAERVSLLVVIHPERPDMMGQAEGVPFLAADLHLRGVDAISLYPDFGRARASMQLFSAVGPHFSEAGRRVEGEAVARYLAARPTWAVGAPLRNVPLTVPSSGPARHIERNIAPASGPRRTEFDSAWEALNSALWMLTHTSMVRQTDPKYRRAVGSLYAAIGALDDGIINSKRKADIPADRDSNAARLHASADFLNAADRDLAPRSTSRSAEPLRVRSLSRVRDAISSVQGLIAECGC